jgi:hypothetical protein
MNTRLALPNRRTHITQKVKIAGQHMHYVSIHIGENPTQTFQWQHVGLLIKRCPVDQSRLTQEHVSEQNNKDLD